jgi:tRNA C32,U32 (ribose-2'-O)-methylase TrmJ
MTWMNEYEIEEMQHRIEKDETPNLAEAAWVLNNLMNWTNRNSDGWPYWQKPSRAAKTLMGLLHERDYAIRFGHDRMGKPLEDITKAQLTAAIRPIKAFFTKQDVDYALVLAR